MASNRRIPAAQTLSARWARFQRKVERRDRAEYDSIEPHHFRWLEVYHGSDIKPSRLFFSMRDLLFRRFKLDNRFPRDWHALVRWGTLTQSFMNAVQDHARQLQLPILYIGALKPFDLTVFAALRFGDAEFTRRSRSAVPVHYLGIDDRWMQVCFDSLLPKHTSKQFSHPMRPIEREHFKFVQEMLPDLEELVGPRSFEILKSGHYIPFEAVSGTGYFNESFHPRLLAHLKRASAPFARK